MLTKAPVLSSSLTDVAAPVPAGSPDTKNAIHNVTQDYSSFQKEPAGVTQQNQRMESALGDAVLRFLRLRKGRKRPQHDPNGVCRGVEVRLA